MSRSIKTIAIIESGHRWIFLIDDSPRSLHAIFDVLNAYERDPDSGFTSWHANKVLRVLASLLFAEYASRKIDATLNGTAMMSSTKRSSSVN